MFSHGRDMACLPVTAYGLEAHPVPRSSFGTDCVGYRRGTAWDDPRPIKFRWVDVTNRTRKLPTRALPELSRLSPTLEYYGSLT